MFFLDLCRGKGWKEGGLKKRGGGGGGGELFSKRFSQRLNKNELYQ